jgi:glycosyltransferase involved in cell wall biosynthesis
VEKQYLKTVDAFVFNSPSTRRAVAELVTPDPSLIARPSGRRFGAPISPIRIEARAHQPGPLRILFVGNVIPRKNVHALLRGCARIDSVEWRLDIVGNATADEAYTMAVQRTIQKQGLTDVVELHGSVDDSELHTLLQHAHVLAIPSTYEGYGIVYVEGMGQGLPALATPNGGPVDVIDDGVTGFLLDDPVEDGIADRLRMLASNRDRLAHMGRAAREAYVASPTWTDTGRAVTTFLRRLTRDRL